MARMSAILPPTAALAAGGAGDQPCLEPGQSEATATTLEHGRLEWNGPAATASALAQELVPPPVVGWRTIPITRSEHAAASRVAASPAPASSSARKAAASPRAEDRAVAEAAPIIPLPMTTRTITMSTEASIGPGRSVGQALRALSLLAALAACAGGSDPRQAAAPPTFEGKQPSGFVEMREVQVAYIGNAGGGHGTLTYQGQTHPFRIAGLGVGGIGVSTVDAEGEVYGLNGLAEFPGAYAAGQYGAVLGDASVGDIWLKNEHDVVLHLKAKREGLMLSVGADAIDIRLEP
jgi:hypothetical protein